jgi:hypothetical protein
MVSLSRPNIGFYSLVLMFLLFGCISRLKATHMRLDLVVQKKLTTVTVTDKSKGGTVVNRDVVNKGRAFINDSIKIGNSVFEVKSL